MPPIETHDTENASPVNRNVFEGHNQPGLYDVPFIEKFSFSVKPEDSKEETEELKAFSAREGEHKRMYSLIRDHITTSAPDISRLPIMIGSIGQAPFIMTEPYFRFEPSQSGEGLRAEEITSLLGLPHGIYELSVRPTLRIHIENQTPEEPDPKEVVRLVIESLANQDFLLSLLATEPPAGKSAVIKIPNHPEWQINKRLLDPNIMQSEQQILMIIQKLTEAAKTPQRTTAEMLQSVKETLGKTA